MIKYSKSDIEAMDRLTRLTLVNSLSGYKPANLVGTISNSGHTNLAIISSVVHLGSDPALLAFIMRPFVGERHTMENILETSFFTINHINRDMAEKAHYTSADFPREVSEFEKCKLSPSFLDGFKAPFVAESHIKIGLSFVETLEIKRNGTIMVIGQVEYVYMDEAYFDQKNGLDLNKAGTICISGLDSYHEVLAFAQFPYARLSEVPEF
jgi:flavin reductase (DIM6/NTAB) family NADH-FMN oxidoreductase RutF